MYQEYDPFYYVNINAEDNRPYHTAHPNECAPSLTDPDKTVYNVSRHGAEITVNRENFPGTKAVRQTTTVKNVGTEPFTLDTVSSLYQREIGAGGTKNWFNGRFVLHYAQSVWTGEAQWKHVPLEQASLYPTHNHDTHTQLRFEEQGSWTTGHLEPVFFLEDLELGKTWCFESESSSGWSVDLNVRGDGENTTVAVFVSGANEKNDGWFKTLAPGESYTTWPAASTCVEGGFEEALADMTAYRRAIMKHAFPEGVTPLCFNDYMNCLWALPTEENSIALIDAAAEAGCEYYVMDAGWFGCHKNWGQDLGDWYPNDSLFGEKGLQGIFDYVKAKGMKPGIWLEIESINYYSSFAQKHPDLLLYRHGYRVGDGVCFLDYRKQEVRDYIEGVFDMLYGMGVRYVKNDYNQSTGLGVDPVDGKTNPSLAAELEEHAKCFFRFLDKITAKYPDLVIENCGSGAMRSDMGTLSHFYLQSVSDQEDYFRFPSIASGTAACMPPERCGVWAYPYPQEFFRRENYSRDPEFTEKQEDGRITVYNMVSGLMGLLYLSGRIDCADDFNKKLIREACCLYKANRKEIAESSAVYPTGTFTLDQGGAVSMGLLRQGGDKLFLAVWAQDEAGKNAEIDLAKYGTPAGIGEVYPRIPGYDAEICGKKLKVTLPAARSAIFTEIVLK